MRRFRIRLRRSIWGTRSPRLYSVHKESVRSLVHERVAYFNQHYRFSIGKIAIRNQRSRWGSCSKKGNLNFNYKVAFLPAELRDYVIVHEICHLKEFNHSRNFWSLVAETIPNYKDVRKQLKTLH